MDLLESEVPRPREARQLQNLVSGAWFAQEIGKLCAAQEFAEPRKR